jgi:hypothetical protein
MVIATLEASVPLFAYAVAGVAVSMAPPLWALSLVSGTRPSIPDAAALTLAILLALGLATTQEWLLLVGAALAVAVRARRLGKHGWRSVAAVAMVAAGLPLYGLTLLFASLGVAAIGCAPEAYECPV